MSMWQKKSVRDLAAKKLPLLYEKALTQAAMGGAE